MNVSAITLDMLNAAVVSTLADASPAEQGQLLADLIRKFDAELTVAPAPQRKPERECSKRDCKRPWVVQDNGRFCAEHYAMVKAGRAANAKYANPIAKPKPTKAARSPSRGANKKKPTKAARSPSYGANMYTPIRFGGLSTGRHGR